MTVRRSAATLLAALVAAGTAAGCSGDGQVAPSQSAVPVASMVPAGQRWWDDRTFYEIFVRSFADSDGDGIGDLQGVIDKLDHLNDGDPATTTDLGVTGLWLMPIFAAASYHGYDVTDYRSVDPDYGSVEDLEELLAAADERGIAVILDFPLNHTSTSHPWFQASRTGEGEHADWYVWIEGTSDETSSWGAPVWHPDGDRSYLGIFWEGMPDLNLRNPDVTAELQDIARYWIADVGVDGFRLDGVKHLVEEDGQFENTAADKEWLAGFNAFVKSVRADALLVGEIWSGSPVSSTYVPTEVDMAFDFDTADAAAALASAGLADRLLDATANSLAQYPEWQVGVFTDNHDKPRLASLAEDDPGRLRMIATWLLTQPGVPFLYYGQEVGLPGEKSPEPLYDETIRTPMPWTGDGPAAGFTTGEPWTALIEGWEQRNVAAQAADADSLLNLYARLVSVRNATPALRTGDHALLEVDNRDGYAYLRTLGEERVLVVGNASAAPQEVAVTLPDDIPTGTWTSLLGQDIEQPSGSAAYAPVAELAPWEAVVLRLDQ